METTIRAIRSSRAPSFALSAIILSPVVLSVLCWMGTQAPQLNEDQQFRAFVGIFLPFLTGCMVATVVLFRRLYVRTLPSGLLVSSGAIAAALAWPVMVLALVLVGVFQLPQPMLNERTPAPLAWWVTFAVGWFLLVGISGSIMLWLVRIREANTAPDTSIIP